MVNITYKCNGCGGPGKAICVKSCPADILQVRKDHPTDPKARGIVHLIDDSSCIECFACEILCPPGAIFVNPPEFNTIPEVGFLYYDNIEG